MNDQDKKEKCIYCNNIDPECIVDNSKSHVWIANNYLNYKVYGNVGNKVKIQYCPICGHKLA